MQTVMKVKHWAHDTELWNKLPIVAFSRVPELIDLKPARSYSVYYNRLHDGDKHVARSDQTRESHWDLTVKDCIVWCFDTWARRLLGIHLSLIHI